MLKGLGEWHREHWGEEERMGREQEREGHCDIKKGTWPFKKSAPLTRPDQQCNWITKVQVCVCVCVRACVRAWMCICILEVKFLPHHLSKSAKNKVTCSSFHTSSIAVFYVTVVNTFCHWLNLRQPLCWHLRRAGLLLVLLALPMEVQVRCLSRRSFLAEMEYSTAANAAASSMPQSSIVSAFCTIGIVQSIYNNSCSFAVHYVAACFSIFNCSCLMCGLLTTGLDQFWHFYCITVVMLKLL